MSSGRDFFDVGIEKEKGYLWKRQGEEEEREGSKGGEVR
jgi:hypothetical protein